MGLVREYLERLVSQGDRIMAAIDDLNAAVTALTTAVNTAVAEISAEAAAIAAANQNNNSAAIEVAVGNINTLTGNLTAAVAAATPPAPTTSGGS